MLQVISRPGSVNEASAPDMLTPTTLKNLTELFESDHCLKQVQAVENGEEFVAPQPPAPQEKRKKNPLKLESTPFVGGTVIIRTPTDSEQMTILDPAPVQTNKPAPTNQILAMKTRSSSRYVNKQKLCNLTENSFFGGNGSRFIFSQKKLDLNGKTRKINLLSWHLGQKLFLKRFRQKKNP